MKEAKECLKDKNDLYVNLLYKGYYLPNKRSSIITIPWLMGVAKGEYVCLHGTGEGRVNHLPCQNSPPIDVWIDELMKLDSDFGIDDKHKPDKAWCESALATFCPHDHFFKMGYRYVPKPKLHKV